MSMAKNTKKSKTVKLDAATENALTAMCEYTFEHEFEDYVEQLCEIFPEDVDYINECQREGNIESLDKYAWNGSREVPHIYAHAVVVYKNILNKI